MEISINRKWDIIYYTAHQRFNCRVDENESFLKGREVLIKVLKV